MNPRLIAGYYIKTIKNYGVSVNFDSESFVIHNGTSLNSRSPYYTKRPRFGKLWSRKSAYFNTPWAGPYASRNTSAPLETPQNKCQVWEQLVCF